LERAASRTGVEDGRIIAVILHTAIDFGKGDDLV
jgi:hypothetical protein